MNLLLESEAECHEFFEALDRLSENPLKSLRVHPLKKATALPFEQEFPELEPVSWCSNGFRLKAVDWPRFQAGPWMGAGVVYVQEAGAMEAVEMLSPRPGEICLDLCAAPGGKSTQILERLQGQGRLMANEFSRSRASKLDALVARHGYLNVDITSLDVSVLANMYSERFDAILVDAPCSGESLFAKRIDRRSDISDAEIQGCARRQKAILRDALRALAPGGRCVYSTCAYSREENEEVVAEVLEGREDVRVVRESRRWPHKDGVAGGYAALIVRSGESNVREISVENHGLIRSGARMWDGNTDPYAAVMSVELTNEQDWTPHSVDDDQALKFLRGESLPSALESRAGGRAVRVLWRDLPLGPGKAVESRINNGLPKLLRS